MLEIIEKLLNSTIQHGPDSELVYLSELNRDDMPIMAEMLDSFAGEKGYTRILAEVPAKLKFEFAKFGYQHEASIPEYFADGETMLFMSKFFDPQRAIEKQWPEIRRILAMAAKKKINDRKKPQVAFQTDPKNSSLKLLEPTAGQIEIATLDEAEAAAGRVGIKTAYAIVRAISEDINAALSQAGYGYVGTLVNLIGAQGQFESANVWHKELC